MDFFFPPRRLDCAPRHLFPASTGASGKEVGVPDNGGATEVDGTKAYVDATTGGIGNEDDNAHEKDDNDGAPGKRGAAVEDAEDAAEDDEDDATEKGCTAVKDAEVTAEDEESGTTDDESGKDEDGATDDEIEASNRKDGVVDKRSAEDGGAEDEGRGEINSELIPLKGGDPKDDSEVETDIASERDFN